MSIPPPPGPPLPPSGGSVPPSGGSGAGGQSPWNPYQQPPAQPYQPSGGPYQPAGAGFPQRQAGGEQPNPYAVPTVGMAPAVPPAGQGGGRGKRVALAAGACVAVAALVAGGVWVMRGGGEDGDGGGAPSAAQSPEAAALDPDDGTGDGVDDGAGDGAGGDGDDTSPRDPRGGLPTADPVVADDWQPQVHLERENVYDVPPDWEVYPLGYRWMWEVDLPDRDDLLRYPLNAPTTYQDAFCGSGTFRAMIGTTGSRGAVSTEDAAGHNAENYVVAAFDPELAGEWVDHPVEPFENSQGFTGHIAVSEASGYPYDEDDPCAAPSGKVYAVSYLTSRGEIITWILAMTTGVDDELQQETVDQILDSIRMHAP